MNASHNEQYPSWRRWLEAKTEATWREVSQLSELKEGKTPKVLKKYSKLSLTEALETAKHSDTALALHLTFPVCSGSKVSLMSSAVITHTHTHTPSEVGFKAPISRHQHKGR